jgi:hypothetical protein
VVALSPETDYLLQTDQCDCVYSNEQQVQVFIPAGKHTVKVAPDREILAHWRSINHPAQYFYQHNSHQDNKLQGQWLNTEYPRLITDVKRVSGQADFVQTPDNHAEFDMLQSDILNDKYFHRELSPKEGLALTRYQPIAFDRLKAKKWLPNGNYGELDTAYFARFEVAMQANYQLPSTSEQAPLRLYLKHAKKEDTRQDKSSESQMTFSLTSDSGEKIDFIYFPDQQQSLQVKPLIQAKLRQRGVDTSSAVSVATAVINLTQPYRNINIANNGLAALELNLAYRNRSQMKTDEADFFAMLGQPDAKVIINALQTASRAPVNGILHQEITRWQRRLKLRADNFVASNPPLEQGNSVKTVPQIKYVMAKLSRYSGKPITQLVDLQSVLNQNGMGASAKRLLSGLALQSEGEKYQQQAQQLLLDELSTQQRWFDIEGYWAYRLLSLRETKAIVPLSQVLFRQNLFSQANKWFWLAYKAGLLPQIPNEALLAASQSDDYRTLTQWVCVTEQKDDDCSSLTQFDKPLRLPLFNYWQKLPIAHVNRGGRQLIHNQGLDLYMTATRLKDGELLDLAINTTRQIKFTLYPQLAVAEQWPLNSWFIVTTNLQQRRYLLSELSDSLNLFLANDPLQKLAGQKMLIVNLLAGEKITGVQVQGHQALLMLHQDAELLNQVSGCQYAVQAQATNGNARPWLDNNAVLRFDQSLTLSQLTRGIAGREAGCLTDVSVYEDLERNNNQGIAQSPFLADSDLSISAENLLSRLNEVLSKQQQHINHNETGSLLLNALWLEQQQKLSPEVVNAINGLKPTDHQQLSWLSIVNQGYSWQLLQGVSNSAGEQIFERDKWQGRSSYLRMQQAILLQDIRPGERLMSTSQLDVIVLNTRVKQKLQLELRQAARLGAMEIPVQLSIKLDGQLSLITLLPGQSYRHALRLSPGEHKLSISLTNPEAHRQRPWVFFALNEVIKSDVKSSAKQNQLPAIRDKYLVANEQQSLVVQVPEFSWVRIDERNHNGQQSSTMRYFNAAQALQLTANKATGPRYFKLYHWQSTPHQDEEISLPVALASEQTRHQMVHNRWGLNGHESFQLLDRYQNAQQDDGSWGVFAGFRARRNFDEDEQTSQERFYELGWRYQRKLADWSSYIKSEVSVRSHESGDLKTLVAENSALWQLSKFWQFGAALNGYYQLDAFQPNIKGAWSGYTSLNVDWRQYWHDNLDNKLSLTAFSRVLSLRSGELDPQQVDIGGNELMTNGLAVDDDVYSDYKADHRFGLRLSDTLRYTPWLDTELRLQGALTSDTNGNFSHPHKLSLGIGLRQYWQPLIGKVDLQRTRYFRDRNDLNSNGLFDRNTLRLGLTWESWSRKDQLWQIETSINHDLNGAGTNFSIQLHWGQTQNKGFDDFSPNTLVFGALRKRDSNHAIKSNQVVRNDHE